MSLGLNRRQGGPMGLAASEPGGTGALEIHITSLVVQARPAAVGAVRAAIEQLAGAEVHAATADGRLIVTIEAAGPASSACLARIGGLAGVVSTALVFHQIEPASNLDLEG